MKASSSNGSSIKAARSKVVLMRGWTRLLLEETYVAMYCTSCAAYRTAKHGFLCFCHSLFMYLLSFYFFHSCFILPVSFVVFLQSIFFTSLHFYLSFFLSFFVSVCIFPSFSVVFISFIPVFFCPFLSLFFVSFFSWFPVLSPPSKIFFFFSLLLCKLYAFFFTFSFFLSGGYLEGTSAAAAPGGRVQGRQNGPKVII